MLNKERRINRGRMLNKGGEMKDRFFKRKGSLRLLNKRRGMKEEDYFI